jgi:RNA recognition motif-containing protein
MKVYIGNLPFTATERHLEELFAQYGDLVEVTVVLDRETQKPRGFGFVRFVDKRSGMLAIEQTNGCAFQGRVLNVSEARKPAFVRCRELYAPVTPEPHAARVGYPGIRKCHLPAVLIV